MVNSKDPLLLRPVYTYMDPFFFVISVVDLDKNVQIKMLLLLFEIELE